MFFKTIASPLIKEFHGNLPDGDFATHRHFYLSHSGPPESGRYPQLQPPEACGVHIPVIDD